MRHTFPPQRARLATGLSAAFAAIYRHCHPAYTVALGHQSVRALQLVSESGASVQCIARHLDCAPNTASELVRRLAKMELVSKRRGEDGDERSVTVCLTDEGARILLEQTGLDTTKLADRLAVLSEDECLAIQNGLELLLNCLRRP